MKETSALIEMLTKEERKEFILHLKRKNRRSDTKNILLFKLLAAGQTEALDVKVYDKPARNAYHALSKRLRDCLIDFIAAKSFSNETSEEQELLKLLLAARILFERKQYKIAFKTLEKAEKNAHRIDAYSILNEIYHTKIQYAHLNANWNLSDVMAASEANSKLFQKDFQLNITYASIKRDLKNDEDKAINEIIKDAFSEFRIEIDETLTYKSLFQLMEITSTVAKLQTDYHTISPYMKEMYQIIRKKGTLGDKHRYYHIKILNLMAIASFRNKQFEEANDFALQMEKEMIKGPQTYYNRFLEQLTIIQALNLNYTEQPDEALSLLQEFPGDSLDIKLVQLMCLFQQERFKEAYTQFLELHHSDDWYEKKKGWQWVLKKNLIEILLLIEIDKLDLVLLRIQRFKRRFPKKLRDQGEERVLIFLDFVGRYYENPMIVSTAAFRAKVENAFEWLAPEQEDIFVMSFYAWLKAKMEGKNLYRTTLELVRRTVD
ncbi:hypothetical protein FK220_013790 [Flavobacteriaceae bacterium TP-CH-4]|uniref:Uncharacterized protein n=1 Tax=Pelagihabitans pacificus TaxID=2696054 RepID=A0A967EBL1_9FLAO|nr:hypothetical protein [Pelagihabitans pacificus]NHF60421.1 hypothetical protein [Pelagihabitans pacificus]